MGYKFLGFIVWQGVKLYFRRRGLGTAGKLAIGGVATLALGGAVVARRQHGSS